MKEEFPGQTDCILFVTVDIDERGITEIFQEHFIISGCQNERSQVRYRVLLVNKSSVDLEENFRKISFTNLYALHIIHYSVGIVIQGKITIFIVLQSS